MFHREFFDRFYAPNNIVISITGALETEPTLAHLRRTFGTLPRSQILRNPTEEPEQTGERRAVVHFDARAPILAAGWHAPETERTRSTGR